MRSRDDKITARYQKDAQRSLFGLDYRKLPIWTELPLDQKGRFRPSDRMAGTPPYPTTLSEAIWPTAIDGSTVTIDRNGTENFDLAQFLALEPPVSSCAVAFDVCVTEISGLSANGWFQPAPIVLLPEFLNWHFLGYDAADDWLQFSALYGFTWNEDISKVTDDPQIEVTHTGIFATVEGAYRACDYFNELAPEHAPFVPCGVWMAVPGA